ncbi:MULTISPECIES: hypothetical protein [Anoxynatronum]|uniref:Uncharacterized protein n=2 Tax=Anoxynatronum TaxID=210622 RepID=A0AA45WSY5_9CLOT|nr:hypothetical protein [Anoxynatronum buryatiense]SMP39650.1 hypothetical protein SAMN06296020_101254 [Anoxynatronum buryatiense]
MLKRQKYKFQTLLLAAIFLLVGCSENVTDKMDEVSRPQVDLSPRFIQVESMPVIEILAGQVTFQWPGESYSLYEEDQELYALSHDLNTMVHLLPERRQIQVNHWETAVEFMEKQQFEPTRVYPLLQGFLTVGRFSDKHSGLVHFRNLQDENPVILQAKIPDDEGTPPDFLLSPDGSKIVFFDEVSGSLAAYHTVTGRMTQLTPLTVHWFCHDWTSQVTISPKGGYLLVEQQDCDETHPQQFITYGADSGRQIHAFLPGIRPQMNLEETTIAFLLNPGARKIDDQSSKPVQVGIYSLDRRETQFLNQVSEGYSIIGKPVFSETYPYLLYGALPVDTDSENPDNTGKMITYHLNQQVQQTQVQQYGDLMEASESIYFNYPWLVYPLQQDDSRVVIIHHFEDEWTEVIDAIEPWEALPTGQITYFTGNAESGFVYMKHRQLIHFQSGSQRMLFEIPEMHRVKQVLTYRRWQVVVLETPTGDWQTIFPAHF